MNSNLESYKKYDAMIQVRVHFNVKLLNKTKFVGLYFAAFELNEVPIKVLLGYP